MELTIFKSVIYGELKPWASNAVNDKFYRQNLSSNFMKPAHNINEYYNALKELLNSKPNLFKEDGLEIYLQQKNNGTNHEILYPLVETSLIEPITTTQKFYHFLLKNETTRLTNRIFECINKDIGEIQKKEMIQNLVKSCKHILFCIGSDKEKFPKTELTDYVIPQLITNVIRLLKETEKLYPQFLSELPSNKNELYGELLQQPIPDIDIEKTTPEFQTVNNILLGNDSFKLEKDTRLSFVFNGDAIKLKTVITALNRNIELLNEDKTTIENLLSVLTSKDLKLGAPQIHLGCETTQFSYIVNKLGYHFSNFNPTSIEQSNLFYSKKGTVLNRNNLYKNKNNFPKEQDIIDNIIKQL
ncbi:hypothetical protein EV196_10296 [Mariniflexile fucanivorans]|uniref:Uncharacterized protein n=1 Tax=Mariniflexile fucanivorans TaxID=264023 RepID=A0A4R1RNN5_9FLAO|nr:DUF6617 family protein [Mariniflexile fucanivorans]TCL67540.1 hypothetical protein EV196_10296 [Mariniflexile fucanivorans]